MSSGSVNVTTASGCGWTAVSNASWIRILSGASGTGSGKVNYRLSQNMSNANRSGTITVGSQTYTITQLKK
jgi:hypothetical protein